MKVNWDCSENSAKIFSYWRDTKSARAKLSMASFEHTWRRIGCPCIFTSVFTILSANPFDLEILWDYLLLIIIFCGVDSFSGSRPEKLNNCQNVAFRVFGEINEKLEISWKLVTDGRKNTKTSKHFQNILRKIEFIRKSLKWWSESYKNPKN